MGEPLGFLSKKRSKTLYREIDERIRDYKEVMVQRPTEELSYQGARCMECGTPFCHNLGCPTANLIPEWNDAVYRGKWREAYERLVLTAPFPEITGRICPAPCEDACTLAINDGAVTIREIELTIIEKAFSEGWVKSAVPQMNSGRSVAVVGSGPAGLAAADFLSRRGHTVSLYEKNSRPGGLLRYGIPDFKLDKGVLDRRVALMQEQGVNFECSVEVGKDISLSYLQKRFNSVLLTIGSGVPRDMSVDGRDLDGIHFALDFLSQSNQRVGGEDCDCKEIVATGKRVLVIGGGDTGSDCVGTSVRQGASSIYQFEILPKPPEWEMAFNPDWPDRPQILKNSSSHEEGCNRDWGIETLRFEGKKGKVTRGFFRRVEWIDRRPAPIDGSEFEVDFDLVLLAMGFIHPEKEIIADLGLNTDNRGNIQTDNYLTSASNIYAAGDAMVGASLVVRAFEHGRKAAIKIEKDWALSE